MIQPRAFLSKLELSDAEIDVYLALLKGAQAARDIVATTGRSRPTVYYALSALEKRGLLSKTGLMEDQRIRVEPPKRLKTIIQQKQNEVESLQVEVEDFLGQYKAPSRADKHPSVSFYEGVSAVRNVIMETVYTHSRKIDTLVPAHNFFWQLGPEFVEKYVELRHTLGVKPRNLWATKIDQGVIDKYYDKADIRMLPGGLGERFRSTIFMYDDQVLYISSLASGYALLVKSAEHVEMMHALYGVLWDSSTPFPEAK